MLTSSGLLVGFAFTAKVADESSSYVVNVCGHDSVGLPLARSMDTVGDEYIELHGVDNLIIPISVSELKKTKGGDYAFCVDVVVHTILIKKCSPSHHLFQHLTEKLVALSIEWILRECGVQLLPRTCRIAGNPLYFTDTIDTAKSMTEIMKHAAELFQQKSSTSESQEGEKTIIPDALNIGKAEVTAARQPLIREVVSTPAIKKGFLVDGHARLYGPDGTREGSGKAPDPLAHIPKSLREKCKIIDTRDMGQLTGLATETPKLDSTVQKLHPSSKPFAPVAKSPKADGDAWSNFSIERTQEKIVVKFPLPDGVLSLRDIDLSATTDTLEINGSVVQLPVPIVTDDVRAKLIKATRILVVTCMIDV